MTRAKAGPKAYVALLRGINLGSRNRVGMADLRALVATVGAEDVSTYVQSGNVVFRTAVASGEALERAIEASLREELGLDVPVLVRTAEELSRVVDRNPFIARGSEESTLHVTFLAGPPAADRIDSLDPAAGLPDEFLVDGREVYLSCPTGYGRTKLDNASIERRLAVVATTRNWRTVTALAELAGG